MIKDLEQTVRRILHGLPAGGTLTTRQLSDLIHAERPNELDPMTLTRDLMTLSDNVPSLAAKFEDEQTKGFMKGKTIKRRLWHHIDSPDMPARPPRQSLGAASPGTSMQQQISELAAEVAQLRADVDDLRSIT